MTAVRSGGLTHFLGLVLLLLALWLTLGLALELM